MLKPLNDRLEMSSYPERPNKASVLKSSTLLNSLAEEDLDRLAQVCHLAYAERGEIIWLHGSEIDFFGLVGSGFVKMVKSNASGQELTAEIMGPGQTFGMLGTLDGTGCPLSARAVCNSWYVKIPKREFLPLYQDRVVLKDHLVRRTTTRLRVAYDMMARMSTGRVEERIAAVLMMLSESYGVETDQGLVIDVPLTRQDIAEMAGTTVESSIRTISKWQKANLVSTDQRRITILDEGALTEFLRT